MKSVLVIAIIAVVVCAAAAATTCANTAADCKGPVRKVYSKNDCSGDVVHAQLFDSEKTEGGKCHNVDDNGSKYSGSSKHWCGTSLSGRTYVAQDCEGPYAISSAPTKKCFESDLDNGTSFEILCASASSVSASVLLLVAMAILAILNL